MHVSALYGVSKYYSIVLIARIILFSGRILKFRGLKQGFANLKGIAAIAIGYAMELIIAY